MVLGHESAGIVHSVGSAVKSLKPGDPVAMEPGVTCRMCDRCREGKYNLCPDMAFAATPPFDGTLARYYRLPEDFCFKLPHPAMDLQDGALIEPLAVAVHISRQADIKVGDKVVVYGAGPVGLLCAAVAKAFGATTVVSVDVNDDRLKFAKDYTATHTFKPKGPDESAADGAARLKRESGLGDGPEQGADVVIEASGAEPCIQQGIHVVRWGGRYVQGGMGKPEVTFPITSFCTKEIIAKGSFRYGPGDYALAIQLVATKKVSVKELVTGKVKFEQAEEAFKAVKEGKGIKTLIEGPA